MIGRFSSNFIKYLAMGLAFALISFLFRSCDVKAESFTPTNTLEVWTSSSSARATGVLHYFQNGLDLYDSNLSHSETYSFFGLYGVTNNSVVGNYFSYFVETTASSYTSIMQLSDGSYVNCDVSSSIVADGMNIVAFTCSLPINATVYKYGVSIPNGVPGPNVKISKLTYFMNATASQINDIQNSITSVFNNISNVANSVKDVENAVKDTNDTMKDDNIDTSSSNSFFNNFKSSDHGLTGIVSAPLKIINQFTTTTCKSVNIDFLGAKADLPCGSTLWGREDLKTFVDIYNVVMGGLISYGALKGIFNRVQGFKNPDNSKVEVIDL